MLPVALELEKNEVFINLVFRSLFRTDHFYTLVIRYTKLFLIDDNVIPAMLCHAQMQVGYHRCKAYCSKHGNKDRKWKPNKSKQNDMYKVCTFSSLQQ